MNTRICYLYRDARNYKVYQEAVLSGSLSLDQVKKIFDCCATEDHYFIPADIGLPEERFPSWSTGDTEWFELEAIESTQDPPDIILTTDQLLSHFLISARDWAKEW